MSASISPNLPPNLDSTHSLGHNAFCARFGHFTIPLEEVDGISREKFKDLIKIREGRNLKFFVVVANENGKFHFFEASQLLNKILTNEELRNPYTWQLIEDLEIFVFSPSQGRFDNYLTIKVSECRNNKALLLPIFFNDDSRSEKERSDFLLDMASVYENGYSHFLKDESVAMFFYYQAAQLGSKRAQKEIARIYRKRNQQEESEKWFRTFLVNNEQASVHDLLYFACAILEKDPTEAFVYFERAANKGDFWAIANVIESYELGRGVKQDVDKENFWRSRLPEEWRDKSMADFCNHLNSN